MGRQKKGQMALLIALVTLSLVTVSFVVVGMVTDVGPFSVIDSGDDDGPEQNVDPKKAWKDHELDLKVVAPIASDLEVIGFRESPHEDGEYGNYAEYNSTKAVSGLTTGNDYYKETVTDAKVVTFSKDLIMPSGDYQWSIVDTASSQEYHPSFVDESIPSEVSASDWKEGASKTLIGTTEFRRMASYDEDSASINSVNGEGTEFADWDGSSTNLATSAYESDTGQTATLSRTVTLDHGFAALGTVDVNNVSSDVSQVDVEVYYTNSEGNKESIFDKTVVTDGAVDSDVDMDIPDLGEDEDLGANPDFVNKDLTMEASIEFDGSSVSADEELVEFGVQDIYGDYVGTQNFVNALA